MAVLIPFVDGMKVGLGYNQLNGDTSPTRAVQGTDITPLKQAGGQRLTSTITTITDVEELHKSLGVTVDAGGSYMGFSASAKVDYVQSCDFSSFSTYIVVKVIVENAILTIDDPVFSPDASELLVNNNPERFRDRFGDSFIAGVKTGGEFFAIYQITGSSEQEKEKVAVDVRAAYNAPLGVGPNFDLSVAVKNAKSSSKSHLEVSCFVYRNGTIQDADLDVVDVITTAKSFPVEVAKEGQAVPYTVQIQEYKGLKNPNDQFVYVDIQNQREVLLDLAKKRFEFLALRDNIKYILKHSDDFTNSDGSPVDRDELKKMFDEVIGNINTLQKEASVCTRDAGKCNLSTLDTTKYVLPKTMKVIPPDGSNTPSQHIDWLTRTVKQAVLTKDFETAVSLEQH
jgi:hypothetical protein